jgi:hypothetical protein
LVWLIGVALVALVACASTPPHPAPVAHDDTEDDDDAAAAPQSLDAGPEPVLTATALDTPERSRPPSTATYEQATSTPEALDVNDDHVHLTDGQLSGPVRGAFNGCRVPSNGKVTVKTAVQYGRAIGVTVNVRFVRPKSARPPSRAKAQKEAKASAKIAACVDHNVRDIVWPPSRRRDSFTTEF